MRIGQITGEYPPMQGGVGAFTRILTEHLLKLGHELFVFTSDKARQQHKNVPIKTCQRWGLGTVHSVKKWVTDNGLDIINLQYQTAAYNMSPWIHFLPKLIKCPIVTTFHDLRFPYLFPKAGPLRTWIVDYLARSSAGCIVTNEEDHRELKDISQLAFIRIGTNIVHVPRGETALWRQKAGATSEDFLIAFFGFINHTKGIDVLLKALAKVRQSNPHTKLIILGGSTGASDPTNEPYLDTVNELIDQLSLHDAISWTGFLPDTEVAAYLNAADVVTLPFYDGASFRRGSLLAAIEQSCAIITTDPAVPIPAINNKAFHLIPPNDVDALSQAIIDLQMNPDRIATLQSNVDQIRLTYDWESITRQTSDFYEIVLKATHV